MGVCVRVVCVCIYIYIYTHTLTSVNKTTSNARVCMRVCARALSLIILCGRVLYVKKEEKKIYYTSH